MSIFLILPVVILLGGTAIVPFLNRSQPYAARLTGPLLAALLSALWLLAGQRLPLSGAMAGWSTFAGLADWRLAVDGQSWELSFYFIILLLMVLIAQNVAATTALSATVRLLPAAAAALILLWADSSVSLPAAWFLLVGSWGWFLGSGDGRFARPSRLPFYLAIPMVGLVMAWFGLIAGSDSWLLGSAALLLLALPWQLWLVDMAGRQPAGAMAALLLPLLPALSLLVRLAPAGQAAPALKGWLTAGALVNLLFSAGLLWLHLGRPLRAAGAVAIGQLSLLLLVGLWAGPEAVLAEIQLFIFAAGALFLAAYWPRPCPRWLTGGLLVLPLAALAGVPLTAGFNGRAALLAAWLADNGFILGLLLSLVWAALVSGAFLVFWRALAAEGERRMPLAGQVALLLPSLGLLAWPMVPAANFGLVGWILVFVPLTGAVLFIRFAGQIERSLAFLQASWWQWQPDQGAIRGKLARGIRAVEKSWLEAIAILEGEGGLLWLLLLLAIFLLALQP